MLTNGINIKFANTAITENSPKNSNNIGIENNCAESTTESEEEIISGKNLKSLLNGGESKFIPSTMPKDSTNPAHISSCGVIKSINIPARPIDDSISYLLPKELANSNTQHIIVALSEEAENPHTPE